MGQAGRMESGDKNKRVCVHVGVCVCARVRRGREEVEGSTVRHLRKRASTTAGSTAHALRERQVPQLHPPHVQHIAYYCCACGGMCVGGLLHRARAAVDSTGITGAQSQQPLQSTTGRVSGHTRRHKGAHRALLLPLGEVQAT